MRLAFDDLDVEARSVREGDGLEGDEPPARVLRILGNGVANGLEHSQLVHDIGNCIVGRAHLVWLVRRTMENGFVFGFPF
jgi:hypothetical protein